MIDFRALAAPLEPRWVRGCRWASEAILLAMGCLAPWAFGAVEAWAGLLLAMGVGALAVLGVVVGWGADRSRALLCAPSVALAGLALLALAQTASLGPGVLRRIAPATSELRASLVPPAAERVLGDSGPPVPLPPATLSLDPEASLEMAARLASAWVVFQSVLALRGGFAPFRRFAFMLTANATLLALFSVVQALSWGGKIYWFRESPAGGSAGPFICHNHLAASLNLGLGFAVGCLLAPDRRDGYPDRRGSRLWVAYAAGLIAVGVIASLSRSGFLSLAVAVVAAIVVLRPRRAHLLAGGAAALLLAPVFLFALGGTAPYQQRLSTLLESGPYSVRLEIWRDALRALPQFPVWGTGLGSFSVATVRYFRHDTGDQFVHAENEYVEWLVEGGLVGAALALLGVIGVIRLGRRALGSTSSARDRSLVWGGLLAGATLLVQSLGDFALHIPGVTVAAVLLCAHLSRLGLAAGVDPPRVTGRTAVARALLPGLGIGLLGALLLPYWYALARAEAAVGRAGASVEGTRQVLRPDGPDPAVVVARLDEALGYRPHWGVGHLQLGLAYLGLYERATEEALHARFPDPALWGALPKSIGQPIWLYQRLHSAAGDAPMTAEDLLSHEPVRLYLVPAARELLEARRCSPLLSLAHAKLAEVQYLLEGGDGAGVYLRRAFRLSGADGPRLALVTRSAVQVGDLDLAARCWRKALTINDTSWAEIADAARDVLPPGAILDRVVPDGRYALWFANRLYTAPEDRAVRRRFLQEAVRSLPGLTGLSPAERLRLEAEAWFGLNDPPRALARMRAALGLAPRRADWRKELIEWLIAGGQYREAHDEALAGLHYAPDHPDARRALDLAADALARGESEHQPLTSP